MIPPRDLISGPPDTFHEPVIFCYENKTLILRVKRACCTISVTAIVYDDEAEDDDAGALLDDLLADTADSSLSTSSISIFATSAPTAIFSFMGT